MHEDIAVRHEEGEILLHPQLAHKRVLRPLDDARHHSLADMVLAARHERELHLVAGEGEHRVALGHENRGGTVVGHHGILAVRLTLEGTLLNLSVHVELIGALALAHEEVVPCHLFHHVHGEHLGGMGVEPQGSEYLLETMLLVGILHEEILQLLGNLFFVESSFLSTFCHSSILF